MKEIARGTFTPDQSFSMLLIAKAQYKVRKSDSLLPGTVEKLEVRRENAKFKRTLSIDITVVSLPSILPLASVQEAKKARPI